MSIRVHHFMMHARSQGHSWQDINDLISKQQQDQLAAGEGMWDVMGDLGYGNSQTLRDQLETDAMIARARNGRG